MEGFYDINNKYPWMGGTGKTNYHCPANLSPEVTKAVQDAALKAFRSCGTEVYGRVDVMLRDSDQAPFVLEINTIPGMSAESIVPRQLKAAGISMRQFVTDLAEVTLQRHEDRAVPRIF